MDIRKQDQRIIKRLLGWFIFLAFASAILVRYQFAAASVDIVDLALETGMSEVGKRSLGTTLVLLATACTMLVLIWHEERRS